MIGCGIQDDNYSQGHRLKPGSIPPFGSLFGLKTFCDQRLRDESVINFNAGDHTISISIGFTEYERVEMPEIGSFATN